MNQPLRILFVDDEPSIRQISAKFLARAGYVVDTAEDGAVAWILLQSRRFDLLVTDCDMPRLSGLELLRVLRPAQPSLPVIMISGLVLANELSGDPLVRPTATLLKPFEMGELLETIRIIVECRVVAAQPADGVRARPEPFAGSTAPRTEHVK